MGIKGTVRRSTDGDFIHANVDIDLIITEEPEYGSLEKPSEIFNIIEHFCLGRRRYFIELLFEGGVTLIQTSAGYTSSGETARYDPAG